MYEINKNVVYVKGASQGAIYNFNSGHVFSINGEACHIIDRLINNEPLKNDEIKYLKLLENKGLLDHQYNIAEYLPEEKEFKNLKLAWLEITQACNMKCLHCYEGNIHIQSKAILSLEKWFDIIDQLKELKTERVVVIGGEPTINPNVIEILKYLSNKGIPTTLFTNAYFDNEDLRKVIIENNIKLKISLYGHNSQIHDSITTISGSFDKLLKNINFFLEKNVDISIAVTLMKENEKFAKEIEEFILSLKISQYKFDVIRQVYCGTQYEHNPTDANILNYCKRTQPSFKTSKEKFDKNLTKNSCWYQKLVITEEGKILPCVFERNMILGNVNTNDLLDIINGQQIQNLWNLDYSKIEVCKDCEYRFACNDCRPLAFSKSGNLYEKNIRCTYNPYKGEWNNA